MHFSVLKLVGIAVFSAFASALIIFRDALRAGEDPSDDGPRALIAQFFGLWIGCNLIGWSFFVDGKHVQWALRGAAVAAALAGAGLSMHFSNTTEVPESPDKKPT
jgi:hypothetical protein